MTPQATKSKEFSVSRLLREVNSVVGPRLDYWIDKLFQGELHQWGTESTRLKRDYERAGLVRLGYQVSRDGWKSSIDAMSAIELHDSSLLLIDDVVDDSHRRKSKPTLHISRGIPNAIIVAEKLKSAASLALYSAIQENDMSLERGIEIIELFELTHSHMYSGEYLDVLHESKPLSGYQIDEYFEIIRLTTGIHIGLSLKIGFLLGGGDRNNAETLWSFGVVLGSLLQIRDDFIDYVDNEEVTDKPSFGDYRQFKKRLPLLLVYKHYPRDVEEMRGQKLSSSVKSKLLGLLTSTNVRADHNQITSRFFDEGLSILSALPDCAAKKCLHQLLEHSMGKSNGSDV